MGGENAAHEPVSYTHLDVYKRQRVHGAQSDSQYTPEDVSADATERLRIPLEV